MRMKSIENPRVLHFRIRKEFNYQNKFVKASLFEIQRIREKIAIDFSFSMGKKVRRGAGELEQSRSWFFYPGGP